MRLAYLSVLSAFLILGTARNIEQNNIKQTDKLALRQIIPKIPHSIKQEMAEKRNAALEKVNSEGKKVYNMLVNEIMSKADDYYNEFKKFSDDINQEENEEGRFEKFKEHLLESAQEFAPYIATSYNTKKVKFDETKDSDEVAIYDEPRLPPKKLNNPPGNKKGKSKLLKKRVYSPLKDKIFDYFYDYNSQF